MADLPQVFPIKKGSRKKQNAPNFLSLRYGQVPKEKFVIIVGLFSSFFASIVFVAAFTIATLNSLELLFAFRNSNSSSDLSESILYNIDKEIYSKGEDMTANIINNSNKTIYLAPCEYFNEFQKKVGSKWQTTVLSSCSPFVTETVDAFEKISQKVEEKISLDGLSAGIWRGISNIYFDCRRAKSQSCRKKQAIYSPEFEIKDKLK